MWQLQLIKNSSVLKAADVSSDQNHNKNSASSSPVCSEKSQINKLAALNTK
jgi:hypothetical protein